MVVGGIGNSCSWFVGLPRKGDPRQTDLSPLLLFIDGQPAGLTERCRGREATQAW